MLSILSYPFHFLEPRVSRRLTLVSIIF